MGIDQFDTKRFEAVLPQNEDGPLWEYDGLLSGERVYHIDVTSYSKIIVRSSIDETGLAADSGQDSIRLWLQVKRANGSWQPVKKLDSWTQRTNGWEGRVYVKLRELIKYAERVQRPIGDCEECGNSKGFWFVNESNQRNGGRPASKCFSCNSGYQWMDEPVGSAEEQFPNNWLSPQEHLSVQSELEAKEIENMPVDVADGPSALEEDEGEDLFEALGKVVREQEERNAKKAAIESAKVPNAQQMAAIYAPLDVPIRVIANPGSGKTFMLKHRVRHMIVDEGVDPNNIMVVTFSKAMSDDLLRQMMDFIPEARGTNMEQFVCSIHAACNRILHAQPGFKRTIPKNWEMKKILKEIARDLWPLTDDTDLSTCRPKWDELLNAINNAKNRFLHINHDEPFYEDIFGEYHATRLKTARQRFDNTMVGNHWWTFSDMLYVMERKLELEPGFAQQVQAQFRYVLIDEGQDTNGQAMRILTKIAEPGNRVFIVGDPDQLLYRFTGATPETNLYDGFVQRYPDGLMFMLETNYRSTHTIVEKSMDLISFNYGNLYGPYEEIYHKDCEARDGADIGSDITFEMYPEQADEAEAVASSILADLDNGRKPGDIFVGSRTRAQLAYLESPLTKRGVKFINITGGSFWMLRHVRHITEYLRLVRSPSDEEAFRHIYNVASSHMVDRYGDYSATRYLGRAFLSTMNRSWSEGKAIEAQNKYQGWSFGIKDLRWTMEKLSEVVESSRPEECVRWLIENVVEPYIREEDGLMDGDDDIGKLADLESVWGVAAEFETLDEFLQQVDEALEAAKAVKDKNWDEYVVISTVHRLKGMERPVVYGIGWCEGESLRAKDDAGIPLPAGMLPHTFSLTSPPPKGPLSIGGKGRVEDERCIAYVLVTRAQEEVHLSGFSQSATAVFEPSRFIGQML